MNQATAHSIAIRIAPRPLDLGGGLVVGRVLPRRDCRHLGPFVFLDHMGPSEAPIVPEMKVRQHPHIGLATVTYLFSGSFLHRDSLGNEQMITPGAINWMTAGRGIVHSETPLSGPLHGLQLWTALPLLQEECEPRFAHTPAALLPSIERPGVVIRVLAGTAFGQKSPVQALSPLFFADATLQAGARLLPEDLAGELGIYVVSGKVRVAGEAIEGPELLVLGPDARPELLALGDAPARVVFLGGEALEGERFMEWNFVSSSRARIDRAKEEWQQLLFPHVPGEMDFIPLP